MLDCIDLESNSGVKFSTETVFNAEKYDIVWEQKKSLRYIYLHYNNNARRFTLYLNLTFYQRIEYLKESESGVQNSFKYFPLYNAAELCKSKEVIFLPLIGQGQSIFTWKLSVVRVKRRATLVKRCTWTDELEECGEQKIQFYNTPFEASKIEGLQASGGAHLYLPLVELVSPREKGSHNPWRKRSAVYFCFVVFPFAFYPKKLVRL